MDSNGLGMADTGTAIDPAEMLPAASQGAIGIDCLAARPAIAALLQPVNDATTFACVMAERAFLAALGGTCHSPVAAQARIEVWRSLESTARAEGRATQ